VGAYYPWLDYKWGYAVGVPIKNPLLSDIFSQIFIWKSLIAESFKNWQWPLWNPYSYSGYPLLSNFQSGALNPFNILMVIFGDILGWKTMIITQSVGAIVAMYFFLKSLKVSSISSGIGALVYTFSSFAVTWSQFANLGFAMIWLPLILLFINKFIKESKNIYLLIIAPLIFLLMSAGHFQAFLFGLVLVNTYFIFVSAHKSKKIFIRRIAKFILVEFLSLGLMAIQLLPTYQLMNDSIRFKEIYITMHNYGLLPIRHLVTLLTPNYFGNPATGNYWGFLNYHETTMYFGIVGMFALYWAFTQFRHIPSYAKFFLFTTFFALLMIFANPVSELIYNLHIPFISTSAAGRLSFIYIFSGAVLTGFWADYVSNIDFKEFLRKHWPVIIAGILLFIITYYLKSGAFSDLEVKHFTIALRNIIPTMGLLFSFIVVFLLFNKNKLLLPAIAIITTIDLFYIGWKYTSFVKTDYVYPYTEVLSYLKNNIDFGRVESGKGPIFPANTWAYYRLPSTSGYDPLALSDYVYFYQKNISMEGTNSLSRYTSPIDNYDASILGKMSVKYLLLIKPKNEKEILSFDEKFSEWRKVYEYGSVYVLENPKYKDRVRIENNLGEIVGSAQIVKYSPNEVLVNYTATENANLVLMDTYTHDWKAQINSTDVDINKYFEIFRTVEIPSGSGTVRFYYQPQAFKLGLIISLISLGIWIFSTGVYLVINNHIGTKKFT